MAKIKIKLNSKRSTTIRATDGKYYKLHAGENIIELERSDYSALISALGIKPNSEKKQKRSEPELPKEPVVEQSTEPVVEQSTEQLVADSQEAAIDDESSAHSEYTSDEPVSASDETLDSVENEDSDQFSQMSYTQLKAAYKEITGKNSKLKKDELIKFLQEHNNAE